MKGNISEIPDKHAEDIGLRHVSNGYVGWLQDADGNEYRPPQWLLDLLHVARERGYNECLCNIHRALGVTVPQVPPTE